MSPVRKIGLNVHSVLSRYVSVHNEVYRFSFRKVLPIPGLFKAIDFRHLQSLLSGLIDELDACEQEIALVAENRSLAAAESACLPALRSFASALSATLDRLHYICRQLYERSQGSTAYTRRQFKADSQEYDALVQQYGAAAARLNPLFDVL